MSSAELPPGYVLPPDNTLGPTLLRTVWILLSISTIFLLGRVLVKYKTTQRIYYDDALLLLALLIGYAHAIAVTLACRTGMGRHLVYLSDQNLEDTMKVGLFSLALGFLSAMAGRLALCVFLLFVAGTDRKIKKWTIYVFIFLQFVINVCAVIVAFAQCGKQPDILWDPSKQYEYESHCWNIHVWTDYSYFQGSFNTLTDVFLTVVPAAMILHTKLAGKDKIGLAFLLCLSVLAMIASIIKTYESKALNQIEDFTYDLVPFVVWMSIELNIVVIVASVPLLRPLFPGGLIRKRQSHGRPATNTGQGRKGIAMGPLPSKDTTRSATTRLSSTSREKIFSPADFDLEDTGIIRTVEVSVTFSPNDTPFVHAALVGLVEGEIMHPRRGRTLNQRLW